MVSRHSSEVKIFQWYFKMIFITFATIAAHLLPGWSIGHSHLSRLLGGRACMRAGNAKTGRCAKGPYCVFYLWCTIAIYWYYVSAPRTSASWVVDEFDEKHNLVHTNYITPGIHWRKQRMLPVLWFLHHTFRIMIFFTVHGELRYGDFANAACP